MKKFVAPLYMFYLAAILAGGGGKETSSAGYQHIAAMVKASGDPLLNQRVADAMRDDVITEAEYEDIDRLDEEIKKAATKRQIRAVLKDRKLID